MAYRYDKINYESRTFHAGGRLVTILSRRDCVALYGSRHASTPAPWPVAVISISSSGRRPASLSPALAPDVLRLSFDDVLERDAHHMTGEQAAQVAAFIRGIVADGPRRIVVHCDAGVSRSAGVAAAILDALDDSGGSDAGDAVWGDARFIPNEWCYALVRKAFGLPAGAALVSGKIRINSDAYFGRHHDPAD